MLEIGSQAYCAWVVWKSRIGYVVVMTMSNVLYFVSIVYILCCMKEKTLLMCSLCCVGMMFIFGRMAVLVKEIRNIDAISDSIKVD